MGWDSPLTAQDPVHGCSTLPYPVPPPPSCVCSLPWCRDDAPDVALDTGRTRVQVYFPMDRWDPGCPLQRRVVMAHLAAGHDINLH